jgi:hypothetical protein
MKREFINIDTSANSRLNTGGVPEEYRDNNGCGTLVVLMLIAAALLIIMWIAYFHFRK